MKWADAWLENKDRSIAAAMAAAVAAGAAAWAVAAREAAKVAEAEGIDLIALAHEAWN